MANVILDDNEKPLGRTESAQLLTDAGYKTSPATLATLASRGNGPPFRRYGRIPVYMPSDLLSWARSRLSPPIRSTAEADAQRASAAATNEAA